MTATKYTIKVEIQVLATEVVPEMLHCAAEQFQKEVQHGQLIMSDGDMVEWETTAEKVSF